LEDQLLSFGGRILQNDRTIESYGIGDESVVVLGLLIVGGSEEEEEVPSEHDEALFYDYDSGTDDTASQNSLVSETSTLFNHRRARIMTTVAADNDYDDVDSQATTLEWGGLFEPENDDRDFQDYNSYGFDMEAENEPYDDHGSSDDDNLPEPSIQPPLVPPFGRPMGVELGFGQVAGASVTSPVPMSLVPPFGRPVASESEGDAGTGEPPSQRRRVDVVELVPGFQIFVAPHHVRSPIVLWVDAATTVFEVKCRIVDKLRWWGTAPAGLLVELEGHALENERTIGSYGIVAHTTLRMRGHIGGGGKRGHHEISEDSGNLFPAVGETDASFGLEDELAEIIGDDGGASTARGSNDPVPAVPAAAEERLEP